MKSLFREVLITLFVAVVVFFVLQTTIQSSVVVGGSMEPSFRDGQRLLINKAVYHFREPTRGDVIIFHPPYEYGRDYIKRVIGLPGDIVEIRLGTVYVNGHKLQEPYIKALPAYTLQPYKVKEDSYFVLGDNRNNSNDSHNGWIVPRQNVVGKAWLSIWPPDEWSLIADYQLQEQVGAK